MGVQDFSAPHARTPSLLHTHTPSLLSLPPLSLPRDLSNFGKQIRW